ncbi:MAG: septum formation initiator family protein [Anaerolineaceae bacterium]|nr:septum formation initiator family protein [Anaerolineaceae bacterium]
MLRKLLHLQKKRLFIGSILVLLFFLMMDLNARLSDLSRQTTHLEEISTEVAELRKTEQVLNAQIAYATSEIAIEEWARENAHMALPGDRVIVPLPPDGITPPPNNLPQPAVIPVPNWQIWKILIFGY